MFAKVLRSRLQRDRSDPTLMTINRREFLKVRIARGGEVLAPGDPKKDYVQFIDARDLAEWTIRMVEQDLAADQCGKACLN